MKVVVGVLVDTTVVVKGRACRSSVDILVELLSVAIKTQR